MTQVKIISLLFLTLFFIGCGGTSNEVDYSTMTDAEMMTLADQYKEEGHYEKALENYKRILLDFPTSNLHIETQLKIAETYGAMDKWEDQFNQLDRLIKENIIPQEVPQLYVQIGKFYERAALFNPGIITTDTSDYNLAINYYDQALKYPDSDDNVTKSEAVYRRALVEAKTGKIDEATARYKLVTSLFPESEFSILAQMKLKDPSDVSELSETDSAFTSYKQALGIVEKAEVDTDEDSEEKADQEMESTIDRLDQETPVEEEEYYDEGNAGEGENVEEDNSSQPVEDNATEMDEGGDETTDDATEIDEGSDETVDDAMDDNVDNSMEETGNEE